MAQEVDMIKLVIFLSLVSVSWLANADEPKVEVYGCDYSARSYYKGISYTKIRQDRRVEGEIQLSQRKDLQQNIYEGEALLAPDGSVLSITIVMDRDLNMKVKATLKKNGYNSTTVYASGSSLEQILTYEPGRLLTSRLELENSLVSTIRLKEKYEDNPMDSIDFPTNVPVFDELGIGCHVSLL